MYEGNEGWEKMDKGWNVVEEKSYPCIFPYHSALDYFIATVYFVYKQKKFLYSSGKNKIKSLQTIHFVTIIILKKMSLIRLISIIFNYLGKHLHPSLNLKLHCFS